MKVLVTGAAGFIGMHTAATLLARGDEVVGIDNLNDYYDVSLKLGREFPPSRGAFCRPCRDSARHKPVSPR